MNIIFLDLDDIKNPLLGGGQAVATQEVGTRLAKMGHTVTVISSKYPGYKDRYDNGIYYKHIAVGSKNIKLNNFLYILLVPFTVMRLRADIIVECFTAPVSTLLSPLFTRIPVVGLPTSFDAERFSKIYHLPLWIIEKYGSRFYKYFIALTPFLKEKMQLYNPSITTKIIGQGVGKQYFEIKNKKPEYILFLGRLDIHQKGLDLLLSAYAKVSDAIRLPLVIAGDGPDRKKLEQLIKKYQLEKKVQLVGYADEETKKILLSKAAFVVFPSRSEGFSLFSLEAIASGHRLVSFDIPSLSFADSTVARKAKAFDVDEYASALMQEVKNFKQKNAEVVCRKFAKKYSWNAVTKSFLDFFEEIVV
jgi:glycosyltransferase involved in cell wall biosynthesis